MKSDNTSKSENLRIWKEITKLSAREKKEHTHTRFELMSLPRSSKSRQTCNRTERRPSEGGKKKKKSAGNKNTSIYFVQKNLSCSVSSVGSVP